ncbi:MAG: precorrin-6A/cobalt-precorrin-6A reductase [Alphaproteobacteria bacterium]|nr:MAG: precorrin-6A/cobalt-precorrin-6A reductase [Alphaproteobacteria bacterium]
MMTLNSKKVLVLGGMREGEELTGMLRDRHGIDTILVRPPNLRNETLTQPALHLMLERRSDLTDLMRGVSAVVVAAHPYSARFAEVCAEVAAELGLPCLRLLREPWRPGASDRWIPVDTPRAAVSEVMRAGYQRPFVCLGSDQIEPFSRLRGRTVVFRVPEGGRRPDIGFGRLLTASAEVSVVSETALMRKHQIDVLVTRNLGGTGGWPKLLAARALDIPVVMLRRPKLKDVEHRATAEEALGWVESVLAPEPSVMA